MRCVGIEEGIEEDCVPPTTQRSSDSSSRTRGRRLQQRRRSQAPIYLIGGAVVLVVVLVGFLIFRRADTAIAGVQTFGNLPRGHTEQPVNYPQNPPVGGAHSPAWQNCGIYDQPIRSELAVHSLEHGAVWITYQPDLPEAEVSLLQNLVRGQSFLLLSPYEGLPAPVVASAWGVQLQLDSASDPRLEQFIEAYRLGPQTPEPGASCTGGVGTPIG